ncbi:hypothetical protein WOLCODRAFT_20585 [Wolfiporia cocos MD-104 SS10]|uniref:Uncharacterized protein n=1 Tax=Wolfiporia cocos (strain MD-104) TaxID=742152 RepID=A0A2H3J4B0_WOLCO|nr:hypothetical protein WOLCODRAFT_20585 [Wolfiporia cocos MD-104 SS10]
MSLICEQQYWWKYPTQRAWPVQLLLLWRYTMVTPRTSKYDRNVLPPKKWNGDFDPSTLRTRRTKLASSLPENPVNTKLEFHSIDLSVAIKGAHIATVKHTFQDTFIISLNLVRGKAKGRRRSPRIADPYLVAGIIQTLQMGTESNACLDVTVKSARFFSGLITSGWMD